MHLILRDLVRNSGVDTRGISFFNDVIKELRPQKKPNQLNILDFGCGAGTLVNGLIKKGYNAYGCDVDVNKNLKSKYEDSLYKNNILKPIDINNFQIPFENNSFDMVISTSVFEHVFNKEESFKEIKRVLKKDGLAIHNFPSKYYLPIEPHLRVPLLNYFLPDCPNWYYILFAILGIRSPSHNQTNIKDWRIIFEENLSYCKNNLSYISNKSYEKLSIKIFGNFSWGDDIYIRYTKSSKIAKIFRKLPFKKYTGWFLRNFRNCILICKKE